MPRIKRWFPVSHDFLDDPQTLQLIDQFGPRAIFMWLRMLSWADRNDGCLGTKDQVARGFGRTLDPPHPNLAATRATLVLDLMLTWGWVIEDQGQMWVANYWKYHISRDDNRTRAGKQMTALPSEPSLPSLPKDTEEPPDPNVISVKDLVDSWNEEFAGKLPQVDWPVSQSRRTRIKARLREHPDVSFWEIVLGNILSSPFLLGTQNSNGHDNWKCTLDFLIANDTNCIKIKEGQYAKAQSR